MCKLACAHCGKNMHSLLANSGVTETDNAFLCLYGMHLAASLVRFKPQLGRWK